MLHVYVCTHARMRTWSSTCMCIHARMRRLVWSGDGTYVRRRRPWPAGARQNMRVRIPSNIIVCGLT